MNVLTLSIKQKWFDEIVAGKKTQEFREIRPSNSHKYIRYVLNGREYKNPEDMPSEEDEPGEVTLSSVKYDAIKFLTGEYKGKRPYIVVEVKSAEIQILLERAGMELVTIYDDMTFSPASPENERWVVVAKKMRKETDRRGA